MGIARDGGGGCPVVKRWRMVGEVIVLLVTYSWEGEMVAKEIGSFPLPWNLEKLCTCHL